MKSFWWSSILGVTFGNMIVHRFVLERDWFNAIGIGVTAGVLTGIFIGLYLLYKNRTNKS